MQPSQLLNLQTPMMVVGTPEKLAAFQNLYGLQGLDVQTLTEQQLQNLFWNKFKKSISKAANSVKNVVVAAPKAIKNVVNDAGREIGKVLVPVTKGLKWFGKQINKTREGAEAFMKEHAPDTYAMIGSKAFGMLDKINEVGDSLGGWDALTEAGVQLKLKKWPDVTEEQRDILLKLAAELAKDAALKKVTGGMVKV